MNPSTGAPASAAVEALLAEHAELEQRLADPAVHADAGLARRLGRRYAELGGVVQAHEVWRRAADDVAAARELAAETNLASDAWRLG